MSHKHYKPDILHPWIHPKQKLWPCRWCHLWSVCGPRSSHTKILLTEGQEKSPRPKSFQMDVKCFCDRDVTCDIPYHSQFRGMRRVVTILKTNGFRCVILRATSSRPALLSHIVSCQHVHFQGAWNVKCHGDIIRCNVLQYIKSLSLCININIKKEMISYKSLKNYSINETWHGVSFRRLGKNLKLASDLSFVKRPKGYYN